MTTNNHPAHGPVSLDRLHQISEILSKAAAQSDGGNLGYAMADAVKVIDVAIAAFNAEPVAYWRYAFRADGFCYADGINSKKHHDTNPLSQLSDGDYWRVTPLYAAPQSLNDAERAELQERRKADNAEPVADVVVWSSPNEERICDIRWRRFDVAPGPLYTAPPAPVSVSDDYFSSLVAAARVRADKAMRKFPQPNYVLNKVAEESGEVIKAVIHFTEGREEWRNVEGEIIDNLAMLIRLVMEGDQVIGFTPPEGCRAAMLQAGNSPVIQDGWQLVPKEPTEAMNKAGWAAMNEHDAINPTYRAMLAAAPQQDVRLALEIGMSRYAGAMQKLVESGD